MSGGELRAVSQAARFHLLPDAFGAGGAPGGTAGLRFEEMVRTVRELAARPGARKEVK